MWQLSHFIYLFFKILSPLFERSFLGFEDLVFGVYWIFCCCEILHLIPDTAYVYVPVHLFVCWVSKSQCFDLNQMSTAASEHLLGGKMTEENDEKERRNKRWRRDTDLRKSIKSVAKGDKREGGKKEEDYRFIFLVMFIDFLDIFIYSNLFLNNLLIPLGKFL